MSEYVLIRTELRDADLLVGALEDLGIPRAHVERHPAPATLYDFTGQPRPERAELVIRRQHVGPFSNDLGFQRQPDGTWRLVVSAYDQVQPGAHGPYDEAWLGRLRQAYAIRALTAHYRARGWRVAVQRRADGTALVTAEA